MRHFSNLTHMACIHAGDLRLISFHNIILKRGVLMQGAALLVLRIFRIFCHGWIFFRVFLGIRKLFIHECLKPLLLFLAGKCRLGDKLPGFLVRLKQIHPLNLNHLLNVAVAVSLGHLLRRNRHGQCLLIQRQMYDWEIARLFQIFKSAPFPDHPLLVLV